MVWFVVRENEALRVEPRHVGDAGEFVVTRRLSALEYGLDAARLDEAGAGAARMSGQRPRHAH